MLKEILNFVLFGLPGRLSFLLAAAVWAREKREYSDRTEREKKISPGATGLKSFVLRRPPHL